MTHVLDTNTWIVHLRGRNPLVSTRVNGKPATDLALCNIVLSELYYGVFHCPVGYQPQQLHGVAGLQSHHPELLFDAAAAQEAGLIREILAKAGTPIGPNDLLIAANAKAHNLILVTHNTGEFGRVPGLQLEDWQIP